MRIYTFEGVEYESIGALRKALRRHMSLPLLMTDAQYQELGVTFAEREDPPVPEPTADDLAAERVAQIQQDLAALDTQYLPPRVLASLATGDAYAAAQWQAHETAAAPLREELAILRAEME